MRDAVDHVIAQWGDVRPDLDVSAMGVVGRISRAARLLEKRVAGVLAHSGLAAGEFDLLATLRRSGKPYSLTPGQLVATSMVTSGAITARLDRLVAKGLVTRAEHPESRRSLLVTLTPKGLRLVDDAVEQHVANEEVLLAGLSGTDRLTLERLLRKLLTSLGDTGAEGRHDEGDEPQR